MEEDIDKNILSRISLKEISLLSDEENENDTSLYKNSSTNNEKHWRLSYLRNQFESYELQNLFEIYTRKVNHGYFSLFLILQFLLSLTHFCLVVYSNQETMEIVIPDLIIYSLIVLTSLIGLYIVDTMVEKYNKLKYISLIFFALYFIGSGFVPYYHKFSNGYEFRPAYSSHLILACYLFIALEDIKYSILIGFLVSLFHILTLYFVTYSNDSIIWKKIISDGIFAAFINGLGIYYRYMNEIVIRRSFLDRRDCIMSTFQLQHEREQVDQLMKSIIPDYVIKKVKERYITATKTFIEQGKYLKDNPFSNQLLEEHQNVSILFADIVNYTEMTSKLPIADLLETLNDLFGLFDDASKKLKVIRIKFLGDCYYCVSGLPPEIASNPAEACVDLGLEMIMIIAGVRKKRNLNVNMRIGVHSGKIMSGIIGSVKYQFDIWSKDVDIANKMESEGEAGAVHITNKTKELLTKNYNIGPSNKGTTVPQFNALGLETFLVRPFDSSVNGDSTPPSTRVSQFKKQRSFPNGTYLSQLQRNPSVIEEEGKTKNLTFIEEQRLSEDRLFKKSANKRVEPRRSTSTWSWKRRTAFMNNNIKRYTERTEMVNNKMEETIKSISFSKYHQYLKVKEINCLLFFNTLKRELEYLKLPDALFKYYLMGALCLIVSAYLIQNLTLKSWDESSWMFVIPSFPIILIFLPISWAEFIYNKYVGSHINDAPKNCLLKTIYKASIITTNNFYIRLSIFLLIYLTFLISVFSEMIDCRSNYYDGDVDLKNSTKSNLLILILFSQSDKIDQTMNHCVLPWHMTETYAMAVIMSFLFLKIFIWIKLLSSLATIALYAFCVLSFSKGYYKRSESFNYNLHAQVAHIMSTVFLTITLHLVDRQTDYMNRLDFLLNKKLKIEQEEANLLQKVNENLLQNILPKHVARLYLDVNREQKELYFEEHGNVAVMFASIITDNDLKDILSEKELLLLMNAYITEFDVLTNRKEFQSIEKIKIAKWTYMVACGLFPGGRGNELEKHQTGSNLVTMLNFASEMFKKLEQVNKAHFQYSKLRIGISQGDIAAGVVGSKKPLYDIWGDPVNMASRMDSTGLPNRIQVMESTANVLQNLGYSCKSRGLIKVKGKIGLVKTYFVEIDDNYNLIRYQNDFN